MSTMTECYSLTHGIQGNEIAMGERILLKLGIRHLGPEIMIVAPVSHSIAEWCQGKKRSRDHLGPSSPLFSSGHPSPFEGR